MAASKIIWESDRVTDTKLTHYKGGSKIYEPDFQYMSPVSPVFFILKQQWLLDSKHTQSENINSINLYVCAVNQSAQKTFIQSSQRQLTSKHFNNNNNNNNNNNVFNINV